MLVNMKDMLEKAKREHYGVSFFNAVNMEMARAIIETAEDEGILDSDDSELLHNAIDFAEISASEAMTARVDVQLLPRSELDLA